MTPLALDITVGLLILVSTLFAYYRGIFREIFTLAGFALAIFISYLTGSLLVPGIAKLLGASAEAGVPEKTSILGLFTPTMASYIAAYGGVFLLVFILMVVVRSVVGRWIHESGLGIVDRLLGGVFGFARGFLFVFLVYFACFYLVTKERFPEWAKASMSVAVMDGTLTWTKNHLNVDKIIEDQGNGIAIKLEKIDVDKLKAHVKDAAQELKEEVKQEVQGAPAAPEAAPPAPSPEPAPAPAPEASAPIPPTEGMPPVIEATPAPEAEPAPAPVPDAMPQPPADSAPAPAPAPMEGVPTP